MSIIYYPILKAKKGEFHAVAKLTEDVRRQIVPLFELCPMSSNASEAKRFPQCDDIAGAYIDEVASKILEIGIAKTMIDAYFWKPHSTVETGEHVLVRLKNRLHAGGLDVVPVIGVDRWDSKEYRLAMSDLVGSSSGEVCIRLDSLTIEDSADDEYLREHLQGIIDELGLDKRNCQILVDFGDASRESLEDLQTTTNSVLGLLSSVGFATVIVAGCSLPQTIDKAVKTPDTNGTIWRKEMLLWKGLLATHDSLIVSFGDYAVRGPNSAVDVIAPHANGKIRHTFENRYFIARGHSLQLGNKGGQTRELSDRVIQSGEYLGPGFSWGNQRITDCSNGDFRGNSCDWIAIDTNHHITFVTAEVSEHVRKVAADQTLLATAES